MILKCRVWLPMDLASDPAYVLMILARMQKQSFVIKAWEMLFYSLCFGAYLCLHSSALPNIIGDYIIQQESYASVVRSMLCMQKTSASS